MTRSLYDKNERFTDAASVISSIARFEGIEAAFNHAREHGYSIREASHIIHGEVTECELTTILQWKPAKPATSDGCDPPESPPEPTV